MRGVTLTSWSAAISHACCSLEAPVTTTLWHLPQTVAVQAVNEKHVQLGVINATFQSSHLASTILVFPNGNNYS